MSEIAHNTGITTQFLYNWRIHWQKQVKLVPATARPPEQWSPADKLAVVIQAAGLSGSELWSFGRERGLYPTLLARWRQAAEDATSPTAPSMSDHEELQRRSREQDREIRRLEREPRKKEAFSVENDNWSSAMRGQLLNPFNAIGVATGISLSPADILSPADPIPSSACSVFT